MTRRLEELASNRVPVKPRDIAPPRPACAATASRAAHARGDGGGVACRQAQPGTRGARRAVARPVN